MTYQAEGCPCCASRNLNSRPAMLAPFIARYVLDREPDVCSLKSCAACGLMFFATRYDDAEVARLYDGYRGERYLTVRHSFEPWYTRKFNDDIGGPVGISPRQQLYRDTLATHADTGAIGTVLDYAGDGGQLMAGGPGRDLFVFDISGAAPVEGVTGVSDEAVLVGRLFDLVLLCGVVEHFSEPLAQVKQVVELVRPGGLLYVEAPDEQFRFDAIPAGRWYEGYLRRLARTKLPLLLADFWSTGVRVKFGRIPPMGFAKQHEHLNIFHVESLSELVTMAGLAVMSCFRSGGSVVALCRREGDAVAGQASTATFSQ